MLEFVVKPDLSDFKTASWLSFRRSYLSWRTVKVIAAFTAIITGLEFIRGTCACGYEYSADHFADHILTGLRVTLFGIGALMALLALLIQFGSRKSADLDGVVDEEVSVRVGENEFSWMAPVETFHLQWKHISQYSVSRKVLTLNRGWRHQFVIPLDQLEAQTKRDLIEVIEAGGVKRY